MALQKRSVIIDIGFGGLNQRVDTARIGPVDFNDLVNMRLNSAGRFDRRFGFDAVSVTIIGASQTTLQNLPAKIAPTSNDGLLIVTQESKTNGTPPEQFRMSLDGYATSARPWGTTNILNITAHMPAALVYDSGVSSFDTIDGATAGATGWDMVESATHYAIVHHTSRTDYFQVGIYNKDNGALIRRLDPIQGIWPRLLGHPDKRSQWIVGYSSTSATTFIFQTFSLTTSSSSTVTGMPSITEVKGWQFDWAALQDASESNSAIVAMTWINQSTNNLYLRSATWPGQDGSGAAKSTTLLAATTTGMKVAMCSDSNPSNTLANFRPVWHSASATVGLFTCTVNRSLTVVRSITGLANSTTDTPDYLSGVQCLSSTTDGVVIAGYPISPSYRSYIDGFYLYGTSDLTQKVCSQRTLTPCSKIAAKQGGGVGYFWANYAHGAQTAYFLLAVKPATVPGGFSTPLMAKICHDTAFVQRLEREQTLPWLNWSSSVFSWVTPQLAQIGVASNIGASITAGDYTFRIYNAEVEQNGWSSAANKDELLLTGGYVTHLSPTEGCLPIGPLLYPSITVSATSSGGSLATGTYAVSGVWEYTDAAGRVRRSAPATPVSYAVSGTQNAMIVTADPYRFADGLGEYGSNLKFVAYRTLINESQVYYRVESTTVPYQGSTTPIGDVVTVNLNYADTVAAASIPLYTVGGEAQAYNPGSLIAVATNGRRWYGVAGDRPNFVMESKICSDRYGIEFMQDVGRSVAIGGNKINALASHQDRLYAFKDGAILIAQGDGADNTGQNDTLSEFQTLTTSLGCAEPKSVIVTSYGVIFRAPAGIHQIDGGQIRYIGAAVETLVSSSVTIVDAAYDKDNERIHFHLSSNATVILSFFETKEGVIVSWSRDTAINCNSIAALGGKTYFVRSTTTTLYAESATHYVDLQTNATSITTATLATSWMRVGEGIDHGRVYKAIVHGNFTINQTSTTITAYIRYDFSGEVSETHSFDSANLYRATPTTSNCFFEIRPRRTKCAAIRIDIAQEGPTSLSSTTLGTSVTASGFQPKQIELVIGQKAVGNKIPASARAIGG